ncbi:TPA: hypothetical protein BOS_9725 [Bos taurus]|nr:TPA: hypothetical protein BOS_9725 [Bos taurus]
MAFKCSSNTLAASRVGGGGGGWNPAGLGPQLRGGPVSFEGPAEHLFLPLLGKPLGKPGNPGLKSWPFKAPGRVAGQAGPSQAARRARSRGLSRPRGRTKPGEQRRRRREARPLPRSPGVRRPSGRGGALPGSRKVIVNGERVTSAPNVNNVAIESVGVPGRARAARRGANSAEQPPPRQQQQQQRQQRQRRRCTPGLRSQQR